MPYRQPATDTEERLVVVDGDATAVLVQLAQDGWRVVAREGVGWRLRRVRRPGDDRA